MRTRDLGEVLVSKHIEENAMSMLHSIRDIDSDAEIMTDPKQRVIVKDVENRSFTVLQLGPHAEGV